MKRIDFLILGYVFMLLLDFVFLIVVLRFDVLFISGPLALIPLIVTLIRRRKD
ncbi:MAG: hypothetical protein ACFFE4_10405 [Candidatus Thorarchaeota archaeon]